MTISIQTNEVEENVYEKNELIRMFEQYLVDETEWMGSSRTIANQLKEFLESLEN